MLSTHLTEVTLKVEEPKPKKKPTKPKPKETPVEPEPEPKPEEKPKKLVIKKKKKVEPKKVEEKKPEAFAIQLKKVKKRPIHKPKEKIEPSMDWEYIEGEIDKVPYEKGRVSKLEEELQQPRAVTVEGVWPRGLEDSFSIAL